MILGLAPVIYRFTEETAGRVCTLSGLESILSSRSESSHGIMSPSCALLKGRFWSSPVRICPLESTWIWRPLGCFDREILRWLVGELCHGFGQNCPCMHRVCVHWSRFWRSRPEAHTVSCGIQGKVEPDLFPCEIFISSPLGSGGRSDFSTDTTRKKLAEFRAVVLCQDLAYRTFAPVSRECTVSVLESILAFP